MSLKKMNILMMTLSLFLILSSSNEVFAKSQITFLPKSFKTTFTQEYKSALKGKMKKSLGKIEYVYPSQIRFEIDKPDKIIYVSNKKTSWYYTAPFIEGEPGTLSVRKSQKTGLHKFFDSLKKGLVSNSLYDVKTLGKTTKIKFKKKMIEELDIIEAIFTFKGNVKKFQALNDILVTYSDNHKIRMKFEEIKIDIPVKKGRFTFKAPKNTRINQ